MVKSDTPPNTNATAVKTDFESALNDSVDERNFNLQLKNDQISILKDFVVQKKDVFAESSLQMLLHGAAIMVPFSVRSLTRTIFPSNRSRP